MTDEGYRVSRETDAEIQKYIDQLIKWNAAIRLTSDGFAKRLRDCYRVQCNFLNEISWDGAVWIDIGSGSGVPGILVAITQPHLGKLYLIESDTRKCAFLRSVKRELKLKYLVVNERAEDVELLKADIVSARAVAPLSVLLDLAYPLITAEGICVFIKGSSWHTEHYEAKRTWNYDLEVRQIDDDGTVILKIADIERRT